MRMKKQAESGQVLVLLTVGIITLLGFTALAIDGGRLYSEKRTVQGVSDSASLTGALYIAQHIQTGVDSSDKEAAKAAAYQRAESNGYGAAITTVDITEDANYYYVETTIHSTIPPTIVQLVYDGPLSVTAFSQARVPKSKVFALGQALVSLGDTCPGLWFHGNSDFEVHNTGIFSNAPNCDNSVWFSGGPSAIIDGYIYAVGGVDGDDADSISSDGVVNADPIDAKLTTEPDCSDLSPKTDAGTSLQPGIYANGISIGGNADVTLAPGLYCLDNDFRIQNGTTFGEGVTIYMRSGAVTINGGENTLLSPSGYQWQDGDEKYWNGMLFFFSGSNNADLSIAGNASSEFSGTIYNYDGECSLTGTDESVAFNTQVVCDSIEVSGTGYVDITYNPEDNFWPPVNIDLVQ